jgi:hypothetical protein
VQHRAHAVTARRAQIPKSATLDFEIEVLSATRPILKKVLVDSESNLAPKEVRTVDEPPP